MSSNASKVESAVLAGLLQRLGRDPFRVLSDCLPVMVWMSDAKDQCVWFSKRWTEFTGRSIERDSGFGRFDIIHPGDRARAEAAFTAAGAERSRFSIEYRLLRHDGVYRWILDEGGPISSEDGSFIGLVGVCLDIDDRRLLERNNAMLEAIVETSPDFVGIADTESRVIYMNASARALTGSDETDFRSRTVKTYHPSWANEILTNEAFPTAITNGSWIGQSAVLDLHGKEHAMSQVILAHRDRHGAVTHFSTVMRDISALMEAEAELRRSRNQLQSFFDNVDLGLFMGDPEGRRLTLNAEIVRMTGLTSESASNEGWLAAVHEDDRLATFAEWKRALSTKTPCTFTARIVRSDGSIIWVDASSRPVTVDGAITGWVGTVENVTEKLKAEAEIRRLISILDASPDFIGIAEPNGKALYVNRSCRRFLGWTDDETVPTNMIRVSHPEWAYRKIEEEAIPAAVRNGTWMGETVVLRRDGTELPISEVIIAHRDETGRLLYLSTIMRDISAQKVAEDELRTYRDHLEHLVEERTRELEDSRRKLRLSERLASIGTLASGIAHEINNPIGAIQMCAEFALKHSGEVEVVRPAFEDIIADTQRCAKIVRSVLAFGRQGSGKRQPLAINDVAKEVEALTAQAARKRRVIVRWDVGQAICTVVADRVEVQQVMVNLVQNAIQHSRRNGEVVVTTGCDDGVPWVEVKDFGVGMTPEQTQRIFDPFYTTRQSEGGTGLGLSIVHGIVTELGGTIDVTSTPGKGSTFVVRFGKKPERF